MLNHCTTERRFRTAAPVLASFLLVAWALPLQADDLPERTKRALLDAKWQEAIDSLGDIHLMEADATCRMVAAHGCLATNRNNKALLLLLTVKPDDVKTWCEWTGELARDNDDNAVVCYLRGDALARSGDLKGADEWFSRAIDQDKNLGLAWLGRGVARAMAGRNDEAYTDFLMATEAQPNLAEAHASLGCAEVVLEENKNGALDAFNAALKLNPEFALAYNGRGCALYARAKEKENDLDKAAEDFRTAEGLFPGLSVVTMANQTFLLAKVSAQVDRKLGRESAPGTTIKTRIETLPSEPGGKISDMSSEERSALVDRVGAHKAFDMVAAERRELSERLSYATQGVRSESAASARAAGNIYKLEWAKTVVGISVTAATLGQSVAAQGVKTAVKEVAPKIGEAIAKTALAPVTDRIDGPAGAVVRTGVAGVSVTDWIDPVDAGFTAAQEVMRVWQGQHFSTASQHLLKAAEIGAEMRQNEQFQGQLGAMRIMQGDYDPGSRKLTPDEQIRNAVIVSGMRWAEMPELVVDVQKMVREGTPVAVIGETMQAHALIRALENRNIATLKVASIDQRGLAALGRNSRPSAVVGFKPPEPPPKARKPRLYPLPRLRDDDDDTPPDFPPPPPKMLMPIVDDTVRKFISRPPNFPPGGGGGSGLPRPDPIPPMHQPASQPPGNWNWGRPWTAPPGPGGVDSNMDWVFVDKGNWPVVTFFTLAYGKPFRESDP